MDSLSVGIILKIGWGKRSANRAWQCAHLGFCQDTAEKFRITTPIPKASVQMLC